MDRRLRQSARIHVRLNAKHFMYDSCIYCSFRCSCRCTPDCQAGYTARAVVCTDDGSWSDLFGNPDQSPQCVQRALPPCPLISIANSVLDGECASAVMGSTCTVTCAYGYSLVGDGLLTCVPQPPNSPVWDKPLPSCRVAYCPALQAPSNGFVFGQCSPGDPKSQCTFACQSNFVLQGAKVLTCQGDGQWDNEPPICDK